MPPDPSMEMMSEELLDLMCELGYDSDGEPPYFGNMEEEKMLMELFNEVSVGSEPQEEESTSTSTTGTTTTTNQHG